VKRRLFALFVLVTFGLAACGGGGGGGGDATNGSTPVVNVLSATSIGINGATLNGNVTPNGLATNAWFEWGTDSALSTSTSTPSQSIGSGLSIVPISLQITGLAENTKYYFRICASNAKGETESAITSFTTSSPGAAPAVTTLAATSVGANTATLNGNVTANGLSTNAWFEWGTDPSLSTSTSTSSQSVGSGTTSVSVNAALTGLTTGTTYYYRVAATNGSGTTKGNIASFTPGAAPAVTTLAATSVGANTATLNGNVTANGLSTNAWFEWGTDPSLSTSTSTSSQSVGSGTTSQSVSAAITGLSTGTTYYYRTVAYNISGTIRGSIINFTTSAGNGPPIIVSSEVVSITDNSAVLIINLNPNGYLTDVYVTYYALYPDRNIDTMRSMLSPWRSSIVSIGPGTTTQVINIPLTTGLEPGVTFSGQIIVSNSAGSATNNIYFGFTTTYHDVVIMGKVHESDINDAYDTTIIVFNNGQEVGRTLANLPQGPNPTPTVWTFRLRMPPSSGIYSFILTHKTHGATQNFLKAYSFYSSDGSNLFSSFNGGNTYDIGVIDWSDATGRATTDRDFTTGTSIVKTTKPPINVTGTWNYHSVVTETTNNNVSVGATQDITQYISQTENFLSVTEDNTYMNQQYGTVNDNIVYITWFGVDSGWNISHYYLFNVDAAGTTMRGKEFQDWNDSYDGYPGQYYYVKATTSAIK
jgi:hypothetical protein